MVFRVVNKPLDLQERQQIQHRDEWQEAPVQLAQNTCRVDIGIGKRLSLDVAGVVEGQAGGKLFVQHDGPRERVEMALREVLNT